MREITNNEIETAAISERIARMLRPGDVVLLRGDLGAGKTAFVRGLAKGLCCERPVSSPTFALLNEYGGSPQLYHFDLYRLSSAQEAEEIGISEYLYGDGVCAVEWPEVAMALMPQGCVEVSIETLEDGNREITVKGLIGE